MTIPQETGRGGVERSGFSGEKRADFGGNPGENGKNTALPLDRVPGADEKLRKAPQKFPAKKVTICYCQGADGRVRARKSGRREASLRPLAGVRFLILESIKNKTIVLFL